MRFRIRMNGSRGKWLNGALGSTLAVHFFFGGGAAIVAGASLSELLVLFSLLTTIPLLVHALPSLDASPLGL